MASQQVTETPTNVTGQQEEPKEFFAITPLATCPHIDNLSVELPGEGKLDSQAKCHKCSKVGENWVCLKCFEVNCSRFVEGHALEHHESTDHPFALSYADMSVWCYPCNAYIDNDVFQQAKEAAMNSKFDETGKAK